MTLILQRHLALFLLLDSLWLVISVKYYQLSPEEIPQRVDEQKNESKDSIHGSNSNMYYIEEGIDSHEITDIGMEHGKPYFTQYISSDKKYSKFLSEEVSFVVAIVTLGVFLCILSSFIIPLTFMIINGGIMPFGAMNNMMPIPGIGLFGGGGPGAGGIGIGTGGLFGRRRRRRSLLELGQIDVVNKYVSRLENALQRFNKQNQNHR